MVIVFWQMEEKCTLLNYGSVFTHGTEFTMEPVSTILLSRYYRDILSHLAKSGNGRKVNVWVEMFIDFETRFIPHT